MSDVNATSIVIASGAEIKRFQNGKNNDDIIKNDSVLVKPTELNFDRKTMH